MERRSYITRRAATQVTMITINQSKRILKLHKRPLFNELEHRVI